jgi:hypothetical protein
VYGISLESTICAEKVKEPAVVGVPDMTPVVALKLRPPGSEPTRLHFNGAVPPVAVSVAV